MRLKEIRLKGLFRLFDHVVPLKMDERITIVHGPNGYGKTAILRLVAGLLGGDLSRLLQYPFQSMATDFDDNSVLTVSKDAMSEEEHERGALRESVVIDYPPNKRFELLPHTKNSRREHRARAALHFIERFLPDLQRVGPFEFALLPTREVLSVDEVLLRFGKDLPSDVLGASIESPDWLGRIGEEIAVHLIQANRLEATDLNGRRFRDRAESHARPIAAVSRYSSDLASRIQTTLREYGELSQSLDRSFPRRLVEATHRQNLDTPDIKNKLAELEGKRQKLMEAGLLDREGLAEIEVPTSIDPSKVDVLSVYIGDAEKKLAIFDSLFKRIDLFRSILERRLLFKKMMISKETGISFVTSKDQPLPPTSLSTGEQHEIVLLYELLFNVKANSLILIDEPEISLHVAWQREFLKDLQHIVLLSQLDVVIATHSPDIINDRWDLTVELKGPGE
jgi:predicted ATP-binding protein involved in virulence